jgi:hypothetical protein
MPRSFLAKFIAIAFLNMLAAATAAAADGPPRGVYSCYDATMDYKMQLLITPMPVVMFGLVDASTYSDYDGNHGRYSYDAGSGVLTMIDGSRKGWRYHKVGTWSFSLIDNNKGTDIYTCPYEAAKNPAHGPW